MRAVVPARSVAQARRHATLWFAACVGCTPSVAVEEQAVTKDADEKSCRIVPDAFSYPRLHKHAWFDDFMKHHSAYAKGKNLHPVLPEFVQATNQIDSIQVWCLPARMASLSRRPFAPSPL